MSRRVNSYVHVVQRDKDGSTLQSAVFGPDEDLPDWAVESITNADVWADEAGTDVPVQPAPVPDEPQSAKPAPRARSRRGGSDQQ